MAGARRGSGGEEAGDGFATGDTPRSVEQPLRHGALPGVPMLLLFLALPAAIVLGAINQLPGVPLVCSLLLFVLPFGFVLVNPNQSRVVVLFGRYRGTLRTAGLYWVNPLSTRRRVSLRIHNFNSEKLKVNDLRGNPIEIGAVVVWRVADTAQAAFDVENYESYVEVQSESAIRTTAAKHPYDSALEGQTSLRGDSREVNRELLHELGERLALAGVQVLEVRISHLAYAPEIAGAMLRRQQAEAIIDARARIVEGAVGMVKMAIDGLAEQDVLHLDGDARAAMVGNLLVVLCSDSEAQPVIQAGTRV